MGTGTSFRELGCAAVISIVCFTISLRANELRVHEWGTFTTLHRPGSGQQIAWYQNPVFYLTKPGKNVSELPGFVHGFGALKAMLKTTARMETPVVYFYTDKKQVVDLEVAYPGGTITEYYPGYPNQWKTLELIPPSEAGELVKQLPMDPLRPDNHYYEARAVPEAAIVKTKQPDRDGEAVPDQIERFLFYRGMGSFNTSLNVCLKSEDVLQIRNYNHNHGVKHIWILKNSESEIMWQKLGSLPVYDSEDKEVVMFDLRSLSPRQDPEAELKVSMVESLQDAGLTSAEANAMVATWDKQWYQEPGQRVFSIVAQKLIDEQLPLKISPKPAETVRVFVHRQELLKPETLTLLEKAMAPETNAKNAKQLIHGEKLGRFAQGAVESVAGDIGRRTTNEYTARGLEALKKQETSVAKLDR